MEKISDRLWSWASLLEDKAREQAERTSRLCDSEGKALIAGHVALMPDAHWGLGSTVGSVIPTDGVIIPSAVGVDIGCGMIAAKTALDASNLPDSLDGYLHQAERDIPAGVGHGHRSVTDGASTWLKQHPPPTELSEMQIYRAATQFGSLGSGNHFYEVCLDELDHVWLVLHSGSRGIGNQLAQMHIEAARSLMESAGVALEDPDLAYLAQGQLEFDSYVKDMLWAQDYASANRDAMMNAALRGFADWIGRSELWEACEFEVDRVNCHHNYTSREVHDGRALWITRKGAIRAGKGERGVIPGSMGDASYIVEGLGSAESYESCSHGAGRKMSRGDAVRTVSLSSFRDAMTGRTWQSEDAEYLVDESPMAYKPLAQVMQDQQDLVRPLHSLRQVFNYKGIERNKRSRARNK
jgi:tRNA-splicing ligase RtcB